MSYLIIDAVNFSYDGFYFDFNQASIAFERHIKRGAKNILFLEVIEHTGNTYKLRDGFFWTERGWSK